MAKVSKKVLTQRIIIFVFALIVIGFLFIFFKDIFIPFIKLEANKNFDAARDLLVDKGILGLSAVTIIEAFQMVVVFISAEFIQLSAGMAYPWWVAFLLCDLGVVLGASIIYLFVNVFKIDNELVNRKNKIKRYERMAKTTSTIIIMLLLFIMPIVPFGAICYYGSSKKVPYWKYLLTCLIGPIPSIFTSIVMGQAIKEFIANAIPGWILVLIIIGAAALLLALLLFVFNKFFIRPKKGEPTIFYANVLKKILLFFNRLRVKFKVINRELIQDLDEPFIVLANHHSSVDPFSMLYLFKDRNMLFVSNEYLFRIPVVGKIANKGGFIKKKIYEKDLVCVKKIIKTINLGYPLTIFPEGVLSPDGAPSKLDKNISHLCLKLKVPVVLIQLRNNYFLKPKWRKKAYRGESIIDIKRVIMPDEMQEMTIDDMHKAISDVISYNDFSNNNIIFKKKNKAENLHQLLYRCPECKSLYTTISFGNTLKCTKCNKEYHILDNYDFDDDKIKNIYEYQLAINEIEKENIDNVDLKINVDVRIFTDGVRKYETEKGVFSMDNEKVTFTSSISDMVFSHTIHEQDGIAFSVGEEFELYHEGKLSYFYPNENERASCNRVVTLFNLLKEKDNERQQTN